jgi:hypothetical protein
LPPLARHGPLRAEADLLRTLTAGTYILPELYRLAVDMSDLGAEN